jgi:hypothetical protein
MWLDRYAIVSCRAEIVHYHSNPDAVPFCGAGSEDEGVRVADTSVTNHECLLFHRERTLDRLIVRSPSLIRGDTQGLTGIEEILTKSFRQKRRRFPAK